MVDRTNQNTGKLGERIAEKFLISRRFSILRKNFSTPFGEIDLIAKDGNFTVFVEVKTRTSDQFGSPISAITKAKQKHILKNCQFYLRKYGLYEKPCRIDVIGINLCKRGELKILNHLKNAIMI
jgi:putative endonuclease